MKKMYFIFFLLWVFNIQLFSNSENNIHNQVPTTINHIEYDGVYVKLKNGVLLEWNGEREINSPMDGHYDTIKIKQGFVNINAEDFDGFIVQNDKIRLYELKKNYRIVHNTSTILGFANSIMDMQTHTNPTKNSVFEGEYAYNRRHPIILRSKTIAKNKKFYKPKYKLKKGFYAFRGSDYNVFWVFKIN